MITRLAILLPAVARKPSIQVQGDNDTQRVSLKLPANCDDAPNRRAATYMRSTGLGAVKRVDCRWDTLPEQLVNSNGRR